MRRAPVITLSPEQRTALESKPLAAVARRAVALHSQLLGALLIWD